MTVANGDRRWL